MIENWIDGEHYSGGLSGQTISISFEISRLQGDAYLNAHVKVFQVAIRANGKTFEEHIINAFSYTLRETTSNWRHNYMSKFLDYIFWHYVNINRQFKMMNIFHMELKNIK